MPDVTDEASAPVEETELAGGPDAGASSSRKSGSRLVVVLAIAAVGVAVASGLVLGGGGEADRPPGTSTQDPAAALDAALASETPIYILIHSST